MPKTGPLVVVHVFFEDRNSRLFQFAGLLSPTLRLPLLLKEVVDRIGSHVGVTIGNPIRFENIQHITDRQMLCHHLREKTYELGGMTTFLQPEPAYRTDTKKHKINLTHRLWKKNFRFSCGGSIAIIKTERSVYLLFCP